MAELSPPRPAVAEAAPRIWSIVASATTLGAICHKDADGDTLGSALAFRFALQPLGKRVSVVASPPVPQAWWFLPGIEEVNATALPSGGPLFIFDSTGPERAGIHADTIRRAPVVVNIDHHISNPGFGSVDLVITEAASTGEIVFDLLKAWKVQIPPEAAANLYATILSDTGGFRHDNTSEHALRAAAELVSLGADPALIARGLFKSRPASTLRMQGRILQSLHFECGDRLVWGAITQADLRDTGALTEQADGAIDQLNTVRGEEIAILFKQVSPVLTKVSIRTREQVDAAALAAEFGGGGHRRASGLELEVPLSEAEGRVLQAARRVLGCPEPD
jgi:bifunctional oligoribonuclease and PAP phosphatase NrnA